MPGQLFIITAPSGAGKSSLIKALLARDPLVKVSISHTTRSPRPGEENGLAYHFVSRDEFISIRDAGGFLEWAEVFSNFYGTSQHAITTLQTQGYDVILEIDWQGARQVRVLHPDAVGIFILPPSLDTLRQRLLTRAQDDTHTIERRLAQAQADISHENEFDYAIINDEFPEAVQDLAAIVRARRCLRQYQFPRYSSALAL
ncbi:MAG: guanylate kinase [Ferrovum sp.]|jgi:guanylate kinase|nr:guanylate kinase [Ferrovum sp.]NDU87543.1 guanylate kinase [Ferrovum sp.]